MKNRKLFVLIGLPAASMLLSCSSEVYDNLPDLDETAQSQTAFESFLLTSTEVDVLIDTINESVEKILSTRKENTPKPADSLSLVSDDLVLDGRQLALESNVRIFESPNENCLLTYRYPEFSGMRNQALQADINRDLQREVDDLIESSGESYVREHEVCSQPTDLYGAHLEVNPCRVQFVEEEIVSLDCSAIFSGAAVYPIVTRKGININLSTGKIYRFDDLFNEGYDYKQELRRFLVEENDLEDYYSVDTLIFNISENTTFYVEASYCPDFLVGTVCLAMPTNGTSGPDRALVLFLDAKEIEEKLSSERIVEVLVN